MWQVTALQMLCDDTWISRATESIERLRDSCDQNCALATRSNRRAMR